MDSTFLLSFVVGIHILFQEVNTPNPTSKNIGYDILKNNIIPRNPQRPRDKNMQQVEGVVSMEPIRKGNLQIISTPIQDES